MYGVLLIAGHGTHVFGIMAAGHGPFRAQNDPSGVAGIVGPAPHSMASCNCFGRYGEGRDGDVIACIMHAVATGTHWVINLSLGDEQSRNDTAHQLYVDVFTEFCAADGIAVLAAGNGERVRVCVSYPEDSEILLSSDKAASTNGTAAAAEPAQIAEQ
jgi:hypothetical protein